ncbi:CRISPR-associated endonuclease Cas3'' [Thermus sp.]
MKFRAHTPNQEGEWHSLQEHLQGVCQQAGRFAEAFGAPSLSKALAYLHDLGKARAAFQDYLDAVARGKRVASEPHAIWGALLVYRLKQLGQLNQAGWQALALPVMGHHAGLPERGEASSKLAKVLGERKEGLEEVLTALKTMGQLATLQDLLKRALEEIQAKVQGDPYRLEFLIRMAFSTLVDADYLDTEAHFSPETARLRQRTYRLEELWNAFQRDQEALLQGASPSPVNEVRREVYQACLQAAELPPGLFRLTVPTGGGKTRSGLAFALKHALIHGLQRIVVAIPYTSIIDQTAEVYRGILGEEAVLEHHSAYEPPLGEEQGEAVLRQRLATENWDAPLVVTTTVQLFESLFANRPSKMRKIHRLARSVILLDEVQTLPPTLLEPTLEALRLLATPVEEGGYGATVVLSTATQPAFQAIPTFKGLPIREIVPNYPEHFARLQRVAYERIEDPLSWEELAEKVRKRCQIMVVLNTRRDALKLLEALREDPDTFHLSTLLCPAHRREILQEVRKRLGEGRSVRLVSTQVVEAGVDLDFPEVWRAVGPLDRVVQAAGRCNREGRLAQGRVVLFWPREGTSPRGPYRVGIEKARLLLTQNPPERLHDPRLYEDYFRELFTTVETDAKEIQTYRKELNYPAVAQRYRLIPEDTVPVVVPHGEWKERLEDFQSASSMERWRRLQPYVVGLFRHQVKAFRDFLDPVEGWDVYVWRGSYDSKRGLVADYDDPSDLIV